MKPLQFAYFCYAGLLSLLKWRDDPSRLNENLNIFNQKVNGKEFVKFLPDVLDALFSILTENSDGEKYDYKVGEDLNKLSKSPFTHLPALDLPRCSRA